MSTFDPIIKAQVTNGQLEEKAVDNFFLYVTTLPDGIYDITIKKPIKKRSVLQNAYFHGVIVKMLSEETGTDFEDMKDLLKTKFLTKVIVVNDTPYTIVRHSANLSTAEFEELTRQCREFGDQLGIYIPLPNETDLTNYQ